MSGPIVRRYGFPNFDQIFGKKEMEHGVDEPETPAGAATPPENAGPKPVEAKPDPKPETKSGA